jgi:hypothetical protein
LETYRDDYAGYEIDYPADWYITDVTQEIRESSVAYAVTFTSWEPVGPGTEGIPEGGTKFDVSVWKNNATDLEEAAAEQKAQWANADPVQTVLSEEHWTLANGLPARRWLVESIFGQSVVVITVINGNTILIGGLGDYAVVDALAQTLRAAPSGN